MNIITLPQDQLRDAIHVFHGWTYHEADASIDPRSLTAAYYRYWDNVDGRRATVLGDPTRDFAAAGELLEEMPSPLLRKLWDGTGWECASGGGNGFAFAATKEVAVCLAYYQLISGDRVELKEET